MAWEVLFPASTQLTCRGAGDFKAERERAGELFQMEQARASGPSPRLFPVPLQWSRRQSFKMGAEPQGLVVGRLGRPGRALDVLLRPPEMGGICRPRQSQAPCPTSHCGWGHAHLGGVQGVLGDVVLQARAIAVALRPERQAPGWAHRAVLLDVVVASQDLWDEHTHDHGV